jgi:gamma-glutamyltranspeptidase / glutathione hydrolase
MAAIATLSAADALSSVGSAPPGLTSQEAEPHLNGRGGDVPIILHDVRRGKTEVICGQGYAPAAATIAHFESLGLDQVPGSGLLAACVPGTFETWMLLLRDYGTLGLAEILEPAIFYSREGHPLVERAVATIEKVAELFRDHWTKLRANLAGRDCRPGAAVTSRSIENLGSCCTSLPKRSRDAFMDRKLVVSKESLAVVPEPRSSDHFKAATRRDDHRALSAEQPTYAAARA